jgi:predicted  nucleic acid-binding Zn-ribbon protein
MTEHEKQADKLEQEADELEDRSERLDEEISDAREDWEAKKRDDSVPGAVESEDEPPDN